MNWSYSKSRRFHENPKSFLQKYQEKYDGDRESINKGSLIGTAVHVGISSQIDEWSKGNQTSLRSAQKKAEEHIREKAEGKEDLSVTPLVRVAKSHLKTFKRGLWPRLNDHELVLNEETCSFKLGPYNAVTKIDLCTKDRDGNFIITDWKTGTERLAWDRYFQLLVYASYIFEKFDTSLNKIQMQYAYTNTGAFDRENVSKSDIKKVRRRIKLECRCLEDLKAQEIQKEDGQDCMGCNLLMKKYEDPNLPYHLSFN